MSWKDIKSLLLLFVTWRLGLFFVLILAVRFVLLQEDFLGGGVTQYIKNPLFWSWINFDGEHYLAIIQQGYRPLTYFYFPLYPLVARILTFWGENQFSFASGGLMISNTLFVIALMGLKKLVDLDHKKVVSRTTIILLLLFPTSFYFGSFYTESLFLSLSVWSFYFARKKMWLLSGVMAGLSTATRVVGLSLLPALAIEAYLQRKDKNFNIGKVILGLTAVPVGIITYMYFLKVVTGDPLEFLHSVEIFGQQRSSTFVLLPQVLYRYIFKILPNINYYYFPVVFTTYLEFITAVVFLVAIIYSFFRQRLSYVIYSLFAFVIPTLSGSFSSLPRYVLVAFPVFIIFSQLLQKSKKTVRYLVYFLLVVSLIVATSLFTRGYWVS